MLLSHIITKLAFSDLELVKDYDIRLTELCTNIREDNALTFIGEEKYIPFLENIDKLSVICKKETADRLPSNVTGICTCSNPKTAFYLIHNYLANNETDKFSTVIGENCILEEGSIISKHNVVIGNNVTIESGVIIRENVTIGDNCTIGAGTVVGGKGFSNSKSNETVIKLTDCGKVIIGNNVAICSNCHIAVGTLKNDVTFLDDCCQLDAMVHVGHGSKIGKRTSITAGVMIAGNTVIGEDVWLGVNSTISNRITVGNSARISLGAVVTRDVLEGQTVTGNFAIEHDKFLDNL